MMKRHLATMATSPTGLALGLLLALPAAAQDTSSAPASPPPAAPGDPATTIDRAAGQTTPQAAAGTATNDGDQLGDIVVTAQRREQRLQDTPVSVTALSAQALTARGIDNLADVSNFAPNLELHPTNRPAGGGSAFAGYIRGVGTGDFQFPTDPGIGLYVDDVYIARSLGGLLSLEDIARVEVLKGPQGTLYGRNTIGGAINVITTDPIVSGAATGMAKVRFGAYGRADAAALINAPIIDGALGAKFSASYISNDGFGRRLSDGQRYASENRLILRGAIKWQTDGATLKINADYTRQRQNPPSGYFIGFVPSGATVAKIARYNQYAAPFLNAQLGLPAGTIYDGRFVTSDPYRIYSAQPQQDDSDIYGVSAVATFDITDTITLKSITAYRNIDATVEVDGDQTPYPLQQSRTLMKDYQISQEVQLGGTVLDGRLNFLVGGYAFREKGNSSVFTRSFEGIFEALRAAGLPTTAADAGNTFTTFGLEATSYALFTQENLKLTDTLSLTAGGRINRDRKSYSTSVLRPQNGVVVVPLSRAVAEWDSFTPKVGLEWKPTRAALVYASYSKGFKSGGFGASTVASTPTPRYDPEKLTSYELGAKTSWFDDRLTLNVAGFYSEYRDIQLTVQGVDPLTNANIRTTRNAGGSNIKGFEAELNVAPARGLTVNLGVGHVDARFDTLTAAAITSGFTLNSRVPQIPDWSINGGAAYQLATGVGRFTVRGDVSYKGSQFLTAADPTSYQKQYALLGARLAWQPSWVEGLEISVDATNLTDTRYAYYKSTLAPTGQYVAIPGAPREIYGSVRFSF
ncbi:TonB-dependent receptor [Sphingomonas metalli]|uniref:TonB-dependent receptor n=1 Tax=Sphingomonas metalli TaxID=1779358 RepID=A0A916WQ65_9SPHN|nr:TonB-dependent receptor [Sphingomonas metalli]GGB23989.1 TonB-dependent receptor [Sphingomonas metalli]